MDKRKILEKFNAVIPGTLMETLGIRYTDVGEDYLVAEMEVNESLYQPMGLLHGGATIALAESVGSAASALLVSTEAYDIKGVSVTAHHIKSVRRGKVRAEARNIHRGKSTHLWQVRIVSEDGALISLCHVTNFILPKKND